MHVCSGIWTKMPLANRKVDGMPTFLKKVSLILGLLYHIPTIYSNTTYYVSNGSRASSQKPCTCPRW